jgi:RNA polymerase sigma-54 factor
MAHNHYHQIAQATGASREEIQRACRLIRTLDPRPGAPFSPVDTPRYITPDLLVTVEGGKAEVRAADGRLPELKLSSYYQQLLNSTNDAPVRDYLADKVRQASWVMRSIEQRNTTLLSCARAVVGRQEAFFLRGGHLQPMSLADVAADVGVHESTVSRATKDKYLQCPRGLFPLSHFFSRALPQGEAEGISPEMVKAALRELISGEDKRHPLSDQKLCDMMAPRGLLLSRRTVAKYRDEMGFSSAAGRKEF